MELLAGAKGQKRLASWTERFERAGRLVSPAWQVWRMAARVLRNLREQGANVPALGNDVLIAMTARAGGFVLFTSNAQDFERIAAIEPFDLVVVR
jgi:predicted nucleic acid-binding protein